MSDFYDVDGYPMSMESWANQRTEQFKRAKRETQTGNATISTVWLGMDHQYEDEGPPIIFESMVFGGGLDQHTERYSTLAESHEGHDRLVERVRFEADVWDALTRDDQLADAARLIYATLKAHAEMFDAGEDYDGKQWRRLVEAATGATS